MPRTRRAFTAEFKREAVRLVKQPGAKVTHIARDLGIEQSVLRRWVGQQHGGVLDMRPNKPLRTESASERAPATRAAPGHDGARRLKKSARLLCKEPAVTYAFIVRHRGIWPTRVMCG